MKGLSILCQTEVDSNLYQPRRTIRVASGVSEDESDAKTFSVPDSETGQQSAPPIYLELQMMLRQPQQA